LEEAALSSTGEKRNIDICKKKLKKVVSTKLSTEDYEKLRVLTSLTHRYGGIKEDCPSEMLRFIITISLNEFRNKPGFSLIEDSSNEQKDRVIY
jgi:hypothetical protein